MTDLQKLGDTCGYYPTLEKWQNTVLKAFNLAEITIYYPESVAIVTIPGRAILFDFQLTPETDPEKKLYICIAA